MPEYLTIDKLDQLLTQETDKIADVCINIYKFINGLEHRRSASEETLSRVLEVPLPVIKDCLRIMKRKGLLEKVTKKKVIIWGLGKNAR